MKLETFENSSQRLQLALRTPLLLYVFFGVLFIGLGIGCIRMLAVEASIVVEQQRFAYTSTCLWIFDCGSVNAEAAEVRGVYLVANELRAELPDGAHRLDLPSSGSEEKSALTIEIQRALAQPGASFRHEEGSPLAALLLGLVCLGAGFVILCAVQWVSVVADRNAGTIRVARKLLLWPKGSERIFNLAGLEAVCVTPHTLRTGRHIVTSYAVRLKMRAPGSCDAGITFLPMFPQSDAENLARILRTWSGAS